MVQIDIVTQWIEISFTYDLPPTRPLPESYRGRIVSRPPKIVPTTNEKVSMALLEPQKRNTSPNNQLKPPKQSSAKLKFLHYALSIPMTSDNVATIRRLIQSSADVYAKDSWGRMSLHFVTYRCDSVDVVMALIEAGAGVNAKTAN